MRTFAALSLSLLVACRPDAPTRSATGTESAPKVEGEATRWLCRPGMADDVCTTADLTATEVRADGSRVVVKHHAIDKPKVDCFYVYPTVDLDLVPANHRDLRDDRKMRAVTIAQAARFTETCALWAPLYRQVTIGTYLQSKEALESGLAFAFGDVERAFREFLAQTDPTRKIVLLGHSQGAEMVTRLIRRFFDDDPALRARLLLAMPIGNTFDVPNGSLLGGTSKSVPPCTRPGETGCVVSLRTYAEGDTIEPGRWAPPAGHRSVCVDPTTIDGNEPAGVGPHPLSRAYFPLGREARGRLRGTEGITTPFVVYPNFFGARCAGSPDGYAWLLASVPAASSNDARVSPVDLRGAHFRFAKLGLHVLDLQLSQGDLIDMVARRVAALP